MLSLKGPNQKSLSHQTLVSRNGQYHNFYPPPLPLLDFINNLWLTHLLNVSIIKQNRNTISYFKHVLQGLGEWRARRLQPGLPSRNFKSVFFFFFSSNLNLLLAHATWLMYRVDNLLLTLFIHHKLSDLVSYLPICILQNPQKWMATHCYCHDSANLADSILCKSSK